MFRWAYIGSGKIAVTTARAITKSGRHEVVSVYSRNAATAAKFAARLGAKAYTTLEEAVMDERVDAVYIATPHAAHYAGAVAAINCGKPVLVEKAFTINAAECEALMKLAEEKDVFIAEAMWTLFSPVSRQVKEWIDAGRIGRITSFYASYCIASAKFYKAPRLLLKEAGGGCLLDIGVYPLSLCHYLMGEPKLIKCTAKMLPNGVDGGEKIELAYEDGAVALMYADFYEFKELPKAVITGTEGRIEIPLFNSPLKAKLIAGDKKEVFKGRTRYVQEFDAVEKDVKDGKKQATLRPLADTLAVMRIMDECRKQIGLVYSNDEL